MGVWKRWGRPDPITGRRKVTWYAEIRIGGIRRKQAVGSKREAEDLVAEWKREIRLGHLPGLRKVKPILFKDFAGNVIKEHYSAKRSYAWARHIIENRLNPFFGSRLLAAIDAKMISEHMTRRREKGISNGTVNHERAILSKIFRLAVRGGFLGSNPVAQVERLETPKGRTRWLVYDEAQKLIEHSPKHLKAFLIAALETGGRLSEILGLTWDHIDFDRGILIFSQTNTKNAKARPIPMTPLLVATLRALPRSIRTNRVFVRYGKPMRDVRTAFAVAREGAGLGRDVTIHTLRHTWASWYVQRGGNMNLLQDLGGWSSQAMVARYAHLSPGYRATAVPVMGLEGRPEGQVGEGKKGSAPNSSSSSGDAVERKTSGAA